LKHDKNFREMNRKAILLIAASILSVSVRAGDFDRLYEESSNRVASYTNLVTFGSVNPTWTDSTTFFYYAWDGKDFIYYRVDINAVTKTVVPRDTADSYMRARQQRMVRVISQAGTELSEVVAIQG